MTHCAAKAIAIKPPEMTLLALSPDESPTFFTPITQTMFANNTSDVSLLNGIVTGVKENTDSELFVMSQIPADILGSHTSAVSKIFPALAAANSGQNNMVNTQNAAQMAMVLSTQRLILCQTTINSYNISKLSGSDLSNAITAIKSACS